MISSQWITDEQDVRLAPYRGVRDRTLRGESLFLAEGDLVVERLLESRFPVESILISERAKGRVGPLLERKLPAGVPVYEVSAEKMPDVVGFPFHQGVMAAGRRERVWTLDDLRGRRSCSRNRVIVVLPDITKPDNVGVVFRNAAALGADGVLLGERACDPLSRRGLRTSMGGVFQLPWVKTENLLRDLDFLIHAWGYVGCATVLSPEAVDLREATWPERVLLCLGNEYDGLREEVISRCACPITIPMAAGVDSLNLGVSSGIFLYEALRQK
ncbi:MAG: RNA methyltransferase [Planctomycetia bacterium]|nr:RNA methyltransferase [Planctomycetia bacterium]